VSSNTVSSDTTNWIGDRIRWARNRAGMTQQELAKAVDMPQPSIARIERGAVTPRTATLMTILSATGHQLSIEPSDPPMDVEAIRRSVARDVPARTRHALGGAVARSRTSPIRALRRLRRFGVPFVLIGELAEVAHGRPATIGREVEICHATTPVALERIEQTRADLGAATWRHLRLHAETIVGDDYEMLARNAVRMPVGSGVLVPVASLDDLIRIRRAGTTPEDREIAALLRGLERVQARQRPAPRQGR
jgi:transcriptional regulator with XRE-family HTH domain